MNQTKYKLLIASDHAGFKLKSKLINSKNKESIEWMDLGPQSEESVDYPDFAKLLCAKLTELIGFEQARYAAQIEKNDLSNQKSHGQIHGDQKIFGILICGSGQGMAMAANKFTEIRAALCWSTEVAKLAREHNNANVLCLGARFTSDELAVTILESFLKTDFAGGRHENRVKKLKGIITHE
jgi:ribose 5-phosphate isomerase B